MRRLVESIIRTTPNGTLLRIVPDAPIQPTLPPARKDLPEDVVTRPSPQPLEIAS